MTMGDLFEDTAVEGENGEYTARVVDDWAAFGPSGGYLAAIALRAAGAASEFPRPASFNCHYLGPADFSSVHISVRRVFGGRRTETLRVSMTQQEHQILEATVSAIRDSAAVFEDHDMMPMPSSPPVETLTEWEELAAPMAPSPRLKFWQNIDQRLIGWQGEHKAGEPKVDGWYRYRPRPVMPDAYAEAARSVIIVDAAAWFAAMNPHVARARIIAPAMELSLRFYHPARTEWLRAQTRADIALGGLSDGAAAVWSSDGRLVADGGCQMLYRTFGQLPSGALP
jgi:acyl-CoA thioesterase